MTTAATAMGSPIRDVAAPPLHRARIADQVHRPAGVADWYLLSLGLVLMGYALDGRGFAYIGVPPLFIGEAMMLLGLVVLICAWASVRVGDPGAGGLPDIGEVPLGDVLARRPVSA